VVLEVMHDPELKFIWGYFNLAVELDGACAVGVITPAVWHHPAHQLFLQEPVS
jgi:hypothetical protein